MKKILLIVTFFGLCYKSYNQTFENKKNTNTPKMLSNKVLLDSVCNYLLISENISNLDYYSKNRMIFSNQLIAAGGYNSGYISIDTVNLSIRFNYTGTTGSGGFAPYIQQTIYFQDLFSINWIQDSNNNSKMTIKSNYDFCGGTFKPIAELEESGGCSQSSDKVYKNPDYTKRLFSSFELEFSKTKLTAEAKSKMFNWLDEIRTR